MKVSFLSIVFAVALFLGQSNVCRAQANVLSVQELHDDLDSLYAGINDIHPDMFAVVSQKQFEKEIAHIKTQMDRPMTATEFYVLAAPLITKMRDGHTWLYFPPEALAENGKKLFPLSVEVPDKSTIEVVAVHSPGADIPVGAVIRSVNGVSAKKLIAKNLEYAPGELLPHRLSRIAGNFTSVLWSCYPWEKFDIRYAYEGKTHTVSLDGISLEELYANPAPAQETYANYSFKITDGIGIIDFRSFADLDAFAAFADSTFRLLKEGGIENLIIDVRNNGGGNSAIGDTLFQYISHTPFLQFGKCVEKFSQGRIDGKKLMREQFHLFDYMSESEFEEYLYQEPIGTMKTYSESPIALSPNPLRYDGNVYLLTSHYSYSGAGCFAQAFKHFRMGTIVGEEAGQPLACFGELVCQILPNTKLMYVASDKIFYLAGATDKDFDHGTIPDHKVDADKAMDYSVKLIKQGRK